MDVNLAFGSGQLEILRGAELWLFPVMEAWFDRVEKQEQEQPKKVAKRSGHKRSEKKPKG